jgi:predicted nucleic acid-binding protein
MNRYLLDTNVISELRKAKPYGGVKAWLDGLRTDQIYLSAVTMGELQAGVELTRIQDPEKAREIELWIDNLPNTMFVLAMDLICFREWGRVMRDKPDSLNMDAMIAATAKVHGLVVATRNERDFRNLGIEIYNPFRS